MTTWINLQIYTKGVAGVFKGEGVLQWIKQRVITSFRHLNIASCASFFAYKGGGGGGVSRVQALVFFPNS